ncbi:hypothetical protein F1721_10800 [Saccharopolyspora hirsuta]|uniref:Conserved hypothetical protein CHP02679 N terminus domain-containing protein n=1 Tax=Saccharopolyspora hirsuta TaxID=1837 RepID=A0A5M7BZP3_SACHI|nr:hypothetical protein F1721_10800 [Saccharopolyspora hirsuta]
MRTGSAPRASPTDIDKVLTKARHLAAAVAKIDRLRQPGTPPVTLANLAHDCTGDPHDLDLDTLIGQRLVEAVAERAQEPMPYRPDVVRALLAWSGVPADRLSSSVVVLNLRASGNSIVDQRLRLGGGPVRAVRREVAVQQEFGRCACGSRAVDEGSDEGRGAGDLRRESP